MFFKKKTMTSEIYYCQNYFLREFIPSTLLILHPNLIAMLQTRNCICFGKNLVFSKSLILSSIRTDGADCSSLLLNASRDYLYVQTSFCKKIWFYALQARSWRGYFFHPNFWRIYAVKSIVGHLKNF